MIEVIAPLLDLFVPGKPAPQGSKRHVGRGILVESSKALAPWRTLVAHSAAQAWHQPLIDHAVSVDLVFVMPRPKRLPKTRPTPPCTTRTGDVDKLARGCLDALTNVVLVDDALVVDLRARRRYAELDEQPGAHILVAAA